MKKRKFPQDVARFFHPEKSLSARGGSGIHQKEKNAEKSCIVVYSGTGCAVPYKKN